MKSNLVGAKTVAQSKGCHLSTVYRVSNIYRIGSFIEGRLFFSPSEVKKLCKLIKDKPGNPDFSTKKRKNRT